MRYRLDPGVMRNVELPKVAMWQSGVPGGQCQRREVLIMRDSAYRIATIQPPRT
jgi:hypothetical protein